MTVPAQLDDNTLRSVIDEVLRNLNRGAAPAASGEVKATAPAIVASRRDARFGVFSDANSACVAAHGAFLQLQEKGLAGRAKVIEIVKDLCTRNAEEWGRIEFEETKIGRLVHKVEKLQIVKLVPGLEWLRPYALSGDHGITLEEHVPFGVIGAITPVTHSVPTIAGNIIAMVAAGNSVVFNPHPGGARCRRDGGAGVQRSHSRRARHRTSRVRRGRADAPVVRDALQKRIRAPAVRHGRTGRRQCRDEGPASARSAPARATHRSSSTAPATSRKPRWM